MMDKKGMDLILWRHAEAEDIADSTSDRKRRLTPRGEKHAKKMAHWLQQNLPHKHRILVSPTDRTQQTANALELPYDIEKKVGVDGTVADALAAANWPTDSGAVVIVGHQPTLGRIAALLLGGQEADWPMRKGAIWWFSTRTRESEPQIVLRAVINPDFL
jgi:phosphohistidine phosphatase